MSWNLLHKYVVRYCDDAQVDTNKLEIILEQYDISCSTFTGNTALHFAAIGESTTILEYLLRCSTTAFVNTRNENEETALHWACTSGSVASVKLLLRTGADHTVKNNLQNSILHCAVDAGNIRVTKFLLKDKLCKLDHENIDGCSALAVACDRQEFKIIKILVRAGASTVPLIHHYISLNKPKIVKELIRVSRGSYTNEKQQNPLHIAVACNHYKVAKVLLQVNSLWKQEIDSNGNTPANLLQQTHDARLAKLLAP